MKFQLPAIGDYPPEYNPKVHGPYDPARYYGKPDTPFGQVKIGELKEWFDRRDKGVVKGWQAVRRGYFRWCHDYVWPRRRNGVWIVQSVVSVMTVYYIINWYKKRNTHSRKGGKN